MSAPALVEKQMVFNHPHSIENRSKETPPNTLDAATTLPENRINTRIRAIIERYGRLDSRYTRYAKKTYIKRKN